MSAPPGLRKIRLMRPSSSLCTLLVAALLATGPAHADKNPENFPLRLHIFTRTEHTHYHRGIEEASQGDGRANLFANGEVHAVDFHFDCGNKIENSVGFETYSAKWKKPGKQLTVLFPVFGKSDKFFTCDLDTDVKDIAYIKHNGAISEEPAAAFKAWMQKHDYDPEHGKNMPVSTTPEPQ